MKKFFAVFLSLLMFVPITSFTIHANALDGVTIVSTEAYYNKNVDTSIDSDKDYRNRLVDFHVDDGGLQSTVPEFSVEVNGQDVEAEAGVWTIGKILQLKLVSIFFQIILKRFPVI